MSTQRVIIGNSLDILKGMESESVDVCVTSPPYWGLRDYGSDPVIWGGVLTAITIGRSTPNLSREGVPT